MRGQGGRTIKQLSIRSNETKLLLSTTTRREGKGKNRTIFLVPLFFPPPRRDKSTSSISYIIVRKGKKRSSLPYYVSPILHRPNLYSCTHCTICQSPINRNLTILNWYGNTSKFSSLRMSYYKPTSNYRELFGPVSDIRVIFKSFSAAPVR